MGSVREISYRSEPRRLSCAHLYTCKKLYYNVECQGTRAGRSLGDKKLHAVQRVVHDSLQRYLATLS